jgi:hypothetical protein
LLVVCRFRDLDGALGACRQTEYFLGIVRAPFKWLT